ncbi:hypothetical protein ACIP1U_30750 [Cupriavidus sp. NPDC089707]|uniref:hypothetical protein n=1 Tax=Cupriavidus sp. NPDC089707 TaxID=3363963 RepID=UPI0038051E57
MFTEAKIELRELMRLVAQRPPQSSSQRRLGQNAFAKRPARTNCWPSTSWRSESMDTRRAGIESWHHRSRTYVHTPYKQIVTKLVLAGVLAIGAGLFLLELDLTGMPAWIAPFAKFTVGCGALFLALAVFAGTRKEDK